MRVSYIDHLRIDDKKPVFFSFCHPNSKCLASFLSNMRIELDLTRLEVWRETRNRGRKKANDERARSKINVLLLVSLMSSQVVRILTLQLTRNSEFESVDSIDVHSLFIYAILFLFLLFIIIKSLADF